MRKPPRIPNPFSPPKPKRLTAPKIEEPPAPRRYDFERLLCEAINQEKQVSLRYSGDFHAREFEPSVVFHSSKNPHQVNVGGCQIINPNNVGENMTPHNFEVGKIVSLALIDKPFIVRERVDVLRATYANGIICYFQKP
ncbi:hypothetical protein [Shinella sp.]|uniref:hypothetical protein n=1 Tax=Shinella sp. TaxID=1870904 RepID=UPI003F6F2FFB